MASSSSSSHAAPAASSRSYTYNVFLSFRGEDTRNTFVDHLYAALEQRPIVTYKDDRALPRGEHISPSLLKAIEESEIAIIIFSEQYANSSWCLDELAHIMKCNEEGKLTVMPVFYNVDPSDVRKQEGKFGQEFKTKQAQNNKAHLWRNTLEKACGIAGWEPKHVANGHESEVVKEIVDKISERLLLNAYDDDDDDDNEEGLVGMNIRMKELKSKLEIESDGVRMVGIWGCGGIGKTTLATRVYMKIRKHFESYFTLENVKEESEKRGLKKLQKKMLSDFFQKKVKVDSVAEGKRTIQKMLCRRKVLIFLDDVSDLDQLQALVGSHSWFGNGSRIIITTRNQHLLKTHKIDERITARLLSPEESIDLFRRHAYNEKDPVEDYETLSARVISYSAGLPLALRVLGLFLYDKEKEEWISALERLKDIPEPGILDILKISYDGLNSVEKEIFLDIACFWRWRDKNGVIEILKACNLHPEIGIQVLKQKALITITRHGSIDMHDLIQDMGRHIVRKDYPDNPENHSRIWKYEDIRDMCWSDTTMKNDKTKAVAYDDHGQDDDHASQLCKIISNMTKLRYLKVRMRDPKYVEGPIFLSNELRCVDWIGYPGTSPFPDNFQPMKLVDLHLGGGLQEQVWKGCKHVPNLKFLVLRNMDKLLSTPDFDGLPCLERFSLYSCSELKEIHPSLGTHTSLKSVNIHVCKKLRVFPTIVDMKNLERLEIEDCGDLLEFPEIQANMESLVNLSLEYIGIEVLPSSIGERCTNLVSLHLSYLNKLKSIEFNFDALKHLKVFKLKGAIQLEKARLPLFLQFLHSLLKLDLGAECCFKDEEIYPLTVEPSHLQELILSGNDSDVSNPQLPPLKLHGYDGRLITMFEFDDELPSSVTTVNDCEWLCQVSLKVKIVINDGERPLVIKHEVLMAIENHYMLLQLPGIMVAKGFTPSMLRGSRCTLQLPVNCSNDFSGILMCAILPNDFSSISVRISTYEEMTVTDSQDDVIWNVSGIDSVNNRTWVSYVSFSSLRRTTWWDETYKALLFDSGDICCAFGVRLVERKSGTGPTTTLLDSSSSGCTPKFEIEDDTTSALQISFQFS